MEKDVREIDLRKIRPNLRCVFEIESILDLSRSIHCRGQLEPILVCFVQDSFRILDGEKRWRACKRLGMKCIKAILIEEDQSVA